MHFLHLFNLKALTTILLSVIEPGVIDLVIFSKQILFVLGLPIIASTNDVTAGPAGFI